MNRYRHLLIGLAITGLYFINVYVVRVSVNVHINLWINKIGTDGIVDFIQSHQTTLEQQTAYYSLVFRTMFWVYIIVIGLIFIIEHRRIINKITAIKSNMKLIVSRLFKYLLLILGMTIIIYIILFTFFSQYLSSVGENQSIINIVLLNDFNLYIIAVVILLAPIVEEYIFRYGLINHLLTNQSKIFKVVVSALIFSFIHIGLAQLLLSPSYSLYLLLLYMPMSTVYSYVYVKEQNIIFPLAIHIINNIGSILLVLIVNGIS